MEKITVESSAPDAGFGDEPDNLWSQQLTQQVVWITFWQKPWLLAHPSWLNGSALALTAGELEFMSDRCPHLLRRKLRLPEGPPPKPDPALLNLVAYEFPARMQALLLATEVVKPGFSLVESTVDMPTREWCRRLAKALMPGTWPIARNPSQPLMYLSGSLLRLWVPREVWPRLRLLFNRRWLERVERMPLGAKSTANTPAAKLNQLWQAVIWRAGIDSGG